MNSSISYPLAGFVAHMKEAIALNRQRKAFYEEQSKGLSRTISNRLILSERLLIPLASRVDRKAIPFQRNGIRIVADDFVSMTLVPPPDQGLARNGGASPQMWAALKESRTYFRKNTSSALQKESLGEVISLSRAHLNRVKNWEEEANCHFAMHKHLTESIGLIAQNGQGYAQASDGATYQLTCTLIRWHLRALALSNSIDRPAQAVHKLGIGIVVNDLPPIPFG